MTIYSCFICHEPYPAQGLPYKCTNCGGPYTVSQIDWYKPLKDTKIAPGIWRYRPSFGLHSNAPKIYLGEGNTPLVELPGSDKKVLLKLENLNPTGSFKDRGTAILVSMMKTRHVSNAVEDSSGNAGASFSSYSQAFGISSNIFIPASTSGTKRKQIQATGCNVIAVDGSREETYRSAINHVQQNNIPYASHAFLPFGLTGIATIAYELFEQLAGKIGTVLMPVGHGSLMCGILLGFHALRKAKAIPELPSFIGVQPEHFAPVWAQWTQQPYKRSDKPSIAEGTCITNPVRGNQIIQLIDKNKDDFVIVSDDEVLLAHQSLIKKGFMIEPTSAMAYAALGKIKKELPLPIVLVMSGSGLKTLK